MRSKRSSQVGNLVAPVGQLAGQGDPDATLVQCPEAVHLQPNSAALRQILGQVLQNTGRTEEARASFLHALRLDPGLAAVHANVGLALQDEGSFDEALLWLRRATELEPNNAVFWQQIGQLHQEREEPGEAVLCLKRARELAPGNPEVCVALGWALQDDGRLDDAGEQFRAAIALQPSCAAGHFNLGGLHEDLGELQKAETSFRAAIRLQPEFAMAHGRLATLLRGNLPDPDRAALEACLVNPQLGKGQRAHLLFGLAQVLDSSGQFRAATRSLREANFLTLELARGKREYAPLEHEWFVDDLIRAFNAQFFTQNRAAGLATLRPVFVFGLPRSGTTLVEQVLAGHPQVFGAGELGFGPRSFEALTMSMKNGPELGSPQVDPSKLRRIAERHLEFLRAVPGAGNHGDYDRVVDKMPDNYLYLGLLAVLFPNATFIHCRRDLRDVAVSCWMTDFRSIRWANSVNHIASRFQQYHRLMNHWRSVLPVPVIEIDYEETVANLEGVARRLTEACRLKWNASCLDFHRLKRPVRTASATQVRQPVYTTSVARWKNYEPDLGRLFAALPRNG